MARRSDPWGAWWLLAAFLTLTGSAWALSLPLMTAPDEPAHAVRAAGVVRGELVGTPVPGVHNHFVTLEVPAGYARAAVSGLCFVGEPHNSYFALQGPPRTADCPEVFPSDRTAEVLTYEHRGQPTFYALVGTPSLWFTGRAGLYLMRGIGVVACAALLASAVLSARRLPNPRLAVVALLAALTPSALYLMGSVNTSGLEIAAALCAWTSGLALALGPDEPDGRLVSRTAVALTALVVTRGLGPGFAAVVVVVCAALASPARRRLLLARRDVRAWFAVGAVAMAYSVGWLIYMHRSFPLPARAGAGLGNALGDMPWWLRTMAGVMGSDDVVPPVALHVAWGAVVVAVIAWGLLAGRRRQAFVGLGLVALGLIVLVSGEGFSVPQTGYRWQGRYVLPLIVGGLLVTASGARLGRRRDDRRADRLCLAVIAGLVAIQVWTFLYALRHYTVGFDGTINPLSFLTDPIWSPPTGAPWLWLAAFTLGIVGTVLMAWRVAASSIGPTPHDAAAAALVPVASLTTSRAPGRSPFDARDHAVVRGRSASDSDT